MWRSSLKQLPWPRGSMSHCYIWWTPCLSEYSLPLYSVEGRVGDALSETRGQYVAVKPKTATVAAGFHESLLHLVDAMSK